MQKKEKKFGLYKGILILILVAIALSWLIPTGDLRATGYVEGNMVRFGINDIGQIIYWALRFASEKFTLLLAIGGFYGVISKTNGYDRIVKAIAKKLKNPKIAVVLFSTIIAILTSLLTQTFAVLVFIPFIISILNRMKIDKMTILMTTFGSMLVGILGATYGSNSLVTFISYFETEELSIHNILNDMILIRAGILLIGLILFNFITLLHLNKTKDAETVDLYPVEVEGKKRSSVIPIIVIGLLLLALIILGYTNWFNNFNIEVFNNFHAYLDTLVIQTSGEEFNIINSILGTNMEALGTWLIFELSSILVIFTIILGVCYRMGVSEFFQNYFSGVKKMLKPMLIVFLAFLVMMVGWIASTPYMPTIINSILNLTEEFNLATMSLAGLIPSIFNTDLGYTAYLIYPYFNVEYADYIGQITVIFNTLYGYLQFILPSSIVLGIGLVSLDVKYSDWLKHIWKFLVGMLICILVIFILMTLL